MPRAITPTAMRPIYQPGTKVWKAKAFHPNLLAANVPLVCGTLIVGTVSLIAAAAVGAASVVANIVWLMLGQRSRHTRIYAGDVGHDDDLVRNMHRYIELTNREGEQYLEMTAWHVRLAAMQRDIANYHQAVAGIPAGIDATTATELAELMWRTGQTAVAGAKAAQEYEQIVLGGGQRDSVAATVLYDRIVDADKAIAHAEQFTSRLARDAAELRASRLAAGTAADHTGVAAYVDSLQATGLRPMIEAIQETDEAQHARMIDRQLR